MFTSGSVSRANSSSMPPLVALMTIHLAPMRFWWATSPAGVRRRSVSVSTDPGGAVAATMSGCGPAASSAATYRSGTVFRPDRVAIIANAATSAEAAVPEPRSSSFASQLVVTEHHLDGSEFQPMV